MNDIGDRTHSQYKSQLKLLTSYLSSQIFYIIRSIIPLIGIFIGSFLLGKSSSKKGYIEGLKYSAIWIFIFLVFNIILNNFNVISIIYYIFLILISMLGSILGINRKK